MTRLEKVDSGAPRLGEMGLENFPPYLMNRIMGRYNQALASEMSKLGLTTPQMRSLAVLSVIDGILIRELAVYAVVQQSTLSRALETLDQNGFIRRKTDSNDSRATRVFITDAGREGARRAVVDNPTTTEADVVAAIQAAGSRVGISIPSSGIQITGFHSGRGNQATVRIEYDHELKWVGALMGLLTGERTLTMVSEFAMRNE